MKPIFVLLAGATMLAAAAQAGAAETKPTRELLIGRWTPIQGACARSWIDLRADDTFKTPADYQGSWSLKDGFLVALDMDFQKYVLTGKTVVIDRNTIELDGKTRLYRCT